MSNVIKLLPDHVANQIAAGEVVQRPASVVKELLENAVDAKATDIKLIVKDSGKTLIQIIDNGVGMGITDARLCFERHATSKIKHAEDLFAIQTKGFRGEALASIAAVAHVELKTKQDQDELGTHIVIQGSEFVSQEPIVHPKGTSFLVKNLFYNIPARRNFLKSDSLELRHIINEFQRVALTHPNIYFNMTHNGSELFNLPATNLRQRIVNIFGAKSNDKLVPVAENTEVVSIQGFVMRPEFSKKTRGEQFFFVNNRYIKSSYLHHAVLSSFEGLIKSEYHPSYFLYLEVPPHTIDINIHPTKTEIKFEDEHTIYAILRAAVKHSLGQYQIAPVLDFDKDPNLDVSYNQLKSQTEIPKVTFDQSFNPFGDTSTSPTKENVSFRKEKNTTWDSLYVGVPEMTQQIFESKAIEQNSTDLFEHELIENSRAFYFQIKKKFILTTMQSGIVVIHQSRAHQRVLFEELMNNMINFNASSQQLLFPISIEFDASKIQLLSEIQPVLNSVGFVFETKDNNHLMFSALPSYLEPSKLEPSIEELLTTFEAEQTLQNSKQSESLAKAMAKAMAIKTGQELYNTAIEHLINQLFACKDPYVCPNNQPVIQQISVDDIEKKFKL